ncbi:MAG: N-acetylmuramoyl-L-alanine amidase [Christensenellaceae bacterium]|nr:N-acetylmuramoyl-L-alanine amidase [Christensenellaceae bacterium]MDD6927195.1 N-acetylmuramoyl-L-alanine amidase [bacterium]
MFNALFLKKNLIIAAVVAIAALSPVIVLLSAEATPSDAHAMPFTVVIDAGHGGIDGGVTGVKTGVKESDLNLSFSKTLKKYFLSAGFDVVTTRNTAAGLYGNASSSLKKTDMKNRKRIIEKAAPDIVISIHMNKYPLSSRRGAQVFYKQGDEEGKKFAACVQNKLNAMEQAPRECDELGGDYYILNVSPCPAIIAECGFLSNTDDEALLLTETYREELCYAIYKGTVLFLSSENSESANA